MMQKILFYLSNDQKILLAKYFKVIQLETNYVQWALDELYLALNNMRENNKNWIHDKIITISEQENETKHLAFNPRFKRPGSKFQLKVKGDVILASISQWFSMQNARNRKEGKKIYPCFEELLFDHLALCLNNIQDIVFKHHLSEEIAALKADS